MLALFGATALLREALGETCIHYISHVLLHRRPFLSGKDLDSLLSCSNGGRSLGFGASWRLKEFYRGDRRLKLACFAPLLCWLVGMPIKLIAVTAVRSESTARTYFSEEAAWVLGFSWILVGLMVKVFAMFLARRKENYRWIFQQNFARFEAYVRLLRPELCYPGLVGFGGCIGLAISHGISGLEVAIVTKEPQEM